MHARYACYTYNNEYVNQHQERMDSKELSFTTVPYGHAVMPDVHSVSDKL